MVYKWKNSAVEFQVQSQPCLYLHFPTVEWLLKKKLRVLSLTPFQFFSSFSDKPGHKLLQKPEMTCFLLFFTFPTPQNQC